MSSDGTSPNSGAVAGSDLGMAASSSSSASLDIDSKVAWPRLLDDNVKLIPLGKIHPYSAVDPYFSIFC